MSVLRPIVLVLLLLSFSSQGAEAAKRVALLIGNKAYSKSIGPLVNPHNDVAKVAAALQRIGFKKQDIHILYDQSRSAIRKAIRQHASRVASVGTGAIGFFYYSGHGAADMNTRTNYLIPVDVQSRSEDIWDDSVPLSYIINRLQRFAPSAAHFVIFDACRNELQLLGKKTTEKGFVPETARPGMLIAYATDQGSTASDLGNDSGPYATALAEEIGGNRRRASTLFEDIKFRVYGRTESKQLPWHISKFTAPVFLADGPSRSCSEAERVWKEIGGYSSTQVEFLRHLVKQYPFCRHAKLARVRLQTLKVNRANARAEEERKSRDAAEAARLARLKVVDERRNLEAETNRKAERNAEKRRLANLANVDAERRRQEEIELLDKQRLEAQRLEVELRNKAIQSRLKALGCYTGPIDGVFGPGSKQALKRALKTTKITKSSLTDLASITPSICSASAPSDPPGETRGSGSFGGRWLLMWQAVDCGVSGGRFYINITGRTISGTFSGAVSANGQFHMSSGRVSYSGKLVGRRGTAQYVNKGRYCKGSARLVKVGN